MAELGWTTSEVMQEHLQNLVSQGYMMAVDLSACRLLEDLIAPIQAGDMSWHALRSSTLISLLFAVVLRLGIASLDPLGDLTHGGLCGPV
jgi:hypothetical protein